jgi:hypothetical protein
VLALKATTKPATQGFFGTIDIDKKNFFMLLWLKCAYFLSKFLCLNKEKGERYVTQKP